MKSATRYLQDAGINDPTEDDLKKIDRILNDPRYPPQLADWYAAEFAKSIQRVRERDD